MNEQIQKALLKLHATADRDKDGKITKRDAEIVLAQLQAEAAAATTKASPLGAILIAFVAGVAVGAIGHIAWAAF